MESENKVKKTRRKGVDCQPRSLFFIAVAFLFAYTVYAVSIRYTVYLESVTYSSVYEYIRISAVVHQ
jgi:hypothetical protein